MLTAEALEAATLEWLASNTTLTADKVPGISRIASAVLAHASARYDEPTAPDATEDQVNLYLHGLVLQCAHLVRAGQTGKDKKRPAGSAMVFDASVRELLSDFLTTGTIR